MLGSFANPEDLAFARPAPRRPLYHVLFDQPPIWHEGAAGDSLLVEIFEHWLEPAAQPGAGGSMSAPARPDPSPCWSGWSPR